jgi:aminopeptidase-like protein
MTVDDVRAGLDADALGPRLAEWVADLYPICRSVAGEGVRETLERLQELAPVTLHEVPSGTRVFDWTIPREWNIRDAYVANARGQRVVDFRRSNLHVVSHSVPVRARMSLDALRPHLFTLPDRPDWVPYRTSYYAEGWGFCLSQRQLDTLVPGDYEVCIDASLEPGFLTYGEVVLPGESTDEILISAHVCHASLANDNLSGVVIAAHLAGLLAKISRRYSYRFLFAPGTIGAIAWLAGHPDVVPRVRHGLVLACLGDAGRLTYKKSRRGDAAIDRAARHVLTGHGEHAIEEFSPYGYDERQFCSPGFDLPVGRLSRTPPGGCPEYHTSADNLEFVRPAQLAASLLACLDIVRVLEADRTYVNRCPYGEPQLGKRGLYHAVGGPEGAAAHEMALLWALNLSDGRHGVLDIAERSGLTFETVDRAVTALRDQGLLEETR